ncbi:MAG: ATP-dependent Clp protease adaptor ClpS [Verrucomicrobia bacterium]|nr:ATP-dependent Clp protease adaptor ClpS [Verrucomicrobiota bacterium]
MMNRHASAEVEAPADADKVDGVTGGEFQVVLHNDEVHTTGQVIVALVLVFRHSVALARRIMLEAHRTGRAIAQVEPEPAANRHAGQLRRYGLRATVESIS